MPPPPRSLPRAYSSRYIPTPAVQDGKILENDEDDYEEKGPDEDEDAPEALAQGGHSLIGVSIGQRQAQLAGPTATGAQRQAAYQGVKDTENGEEPPEGVDGAEDADQQVSDSDEDVASARTTAGARHTSSAAESKKPPAAETAESRRKQSRGASQVRPRASSLMGFKDDAGWKKFIPSLPRVSLPKISVSGKTHSPKHSQSTTAVAGPDTASESTATVEPAEERDLSAETVPSAGSAQTYRSIVPSESQTQSPTLERPQLLRRTTSDGSLYLTRALSHASSLGDDSRWNDVHEQVNSRMKAIKDTLADSNLKLPSLPDISQISLPKFNTSWLELEGARRRSRSILGNKNDTGSSSPQKKSSPPQQQSPDRNGAAEDAGLPPMSPPPGMSKTSAAQHPHFTRALKKTKGDVVILGGYRGSVLRSAEPPNRQVWVPVKVGLSIRRVNLELGINPEDDERAEENIIPSGMLKNIGPVDISKRLFKRLSSCDNAMNGSLRIWDYGYDWRLNPHFLSAQLIQFLETLPCNSPDALPGERGATVIAHSLGGLITRHAVNKRPELFSGLVYAGVPQNCVNILGPLRNGDDVLLSSRVLTAQVNFTIRTSYALLPLDGKCFFNSETGERYDIDFFDPENWDLWSLSPVIRRPLPSFSQATSSGPIEGLVNSVSRTLTMKRKPSNSKLSGATSHKVHSPTDSTGAGSHNRAVGMQMDNKGGDAHNSNPETSISTMVTLPRREAGEYLARTLAEVKSFKEELAHRPELEQRDMYPPCSVIYGKSVPTVYGARVRSKEAIRHADAYDDLAFASGDGVVLARAAQLPPGYKMSPGGCVSSERGHVSLLGDLEAVGRCLNAIRIEKRRRRGGQRASFVKSATIPEDEGIAV